MAETAFAERTETIIRAALLTGGYSYPDKAFPDHFDAPDAEKAEEEALARGDDVSFDYSDVQWEMPSDGTSNPEEDLRLFQAMGGNLNLSLGDEDDEEWQPEPPPADPILDLGSDDGQREWT